MTILLICLTTALFLPIFWSFASLPYRSKQFGKPDINEPRAQAAQLDGAGHRTVAAQANAWEALLMFATSLGIALVAGVAPNELTAPALLFVAVRVLHGVFYVTAKAPLRTISFMVGVACIVWIISLAFQVA